MNNLKYFAQFLGIIILLIIYKILGLKYSSILSGKILKILGPVFRSNNICHSNLAIAFPDLNKDEKEKIIKDMWNNYGKILAEYMYIKKFRNSETFSKNIIIKNQEILEKIKSDSKPVIFVSGHFNNFELMAMHIEKSGIDVAAIYRPLNNKFLNPIMKNIRVKYICKKQIKKGISGTKEILKYFKNGTSVALMIDQRVSQGINSNFFNRKALTTTIPAQFVKKYGAKIVPIYIERLKGSKFQIEINKSIEFSKNDSIETITENLNYVIENMIKKNPSQWIWTHNRWK
tara:strand:+ start:3082 stop:3945 length:864 start_codon:yes stop_codon:yes gene_type:complete